MNGMISRGIRAGFIIAVLFAAAALSVWGEEVRVRTVAPDEFLSLFEEKRDDGAVLIDVRTSGEYEGGHAPVAVNIDYYDADFRDALDDLDREGTYFLYCRSGSRSSRTLAMMDEMGFEEVYDLRGGWSRNSRLLMELED